MAPKSQIGLVGLAVMGENLALNIERNGFPIAVFNRTGARTKEFAEGPAAGRISFSRLIVYPLGEGRIS